jgi:hypothetical protein
MGPSFLPIYCGELLCKGEFFNMAGPEESGNEFFLFDRLTIYVLYQT